MSEYAPAAIRALYDKIDAAMPAAQLSGILGDSSHTYGYHRARNAIASSDYSVAQSPLDRAGDGWAAAALDVSLPSDLMLAVSSRLMAASKAGDPRLKALREWFGTTNGSTVTGWDLLQGDYTSSDDSHLWHVHLSIHRAYVNDEAALLPIADVIAGKTLGDTLTMAQIDDILARFDKVDERLTALFQVDSTGDGKGDYTGTVQSAVRQEVREVLTTVRSTQTIVATLPTRLASVQATLAKLAAPVAAAATTVDVAKIADAVAAKVRAITWGAK